MTYKSLRPSVLIAAGLAGLSLIPAQAQKAPQQSTASAPTAAMRQKAQALYAGLPLLFEKNEGQTNPQVSFLSRTPDYTLFLTGNEAIIRNNVGNTTPLRMQWLGAQGSAIASGEQEIAGKTNYLIGNDASQWHTKIANYERVKYSAVYPGVDLVYYGNHEKLEYDLMVAPGADPNAIHLHFSGASRLRIEKQSGDLLVKNHGSEVRFHKPDIYQQNGAAREAIAGNYVLSSRNTVSFALGDYDRNRTLVIDPYVVYSTVFGGSVAPGGYPANTIAGLAVDNNGFVYLHGITNFTNVPTTSGAYQPACKLATSGQCSNFFVAKFDTTKSGAASLVYATYLGGSEGKIGTGEQDAILTQANSLAVDSAGDAYITGYSSTYNYPTTTNAYSTTCGWAGSTSCFGGVVSKLDPTGSTLLYSTYIPETLYGGNYGVTEPVMIAIDSSQIAYVAGLADPGLVTTDGSGLTGDTAPFIAAFDTTKSAGASLVYSEYLSLNQDYPIVAIAADPSGNVYLAGDFWPANNPAMGLTSAPIVLNGFQTTTGNGAGIGPVLLRLNHSGAITYASYVGSSNTDPGVYHLSALSVDATGVAYVGGVIATPAPVMNGLASTSGITAGAYLAKVNTNVTGTNSLLYATFLTSNANNASYISGLANNGAGLVGFVGGETPGTASLATIEVNPLTQPVTGTYGQFAGLVDTTMTGDSALTFLSYIDGVQFSGALLAVAFDPSNANNLIIGGAADIGDLDDPFLSVPASFATTEGNTDDPPFFYKISFSTPSALTVSPSALPFGNQVLATTSASQPVTVTNTGATAITISSIVASAQFAEADNCGTSLAASSFCTVNVTFTPSATGMQAGTLTLTDSDSSSPQVVALSGTGIAGTPQAALTPPNLAFGNQTVSTTSSAQVVMLSNPGTAALAISGVSITGANPGDFADTSACGPSLAAGSSCNISVNFTPASVSAFSASLSVADNAAGSPQTVPLTGTGTAPPAPQALLSPANLPFPATTVNSTSAAMSATLSNPGNAVLNIASVALGGANAADFAIVNGCGPTLAAGANCKISATFTPLSAAGFTATITVTDNAAGSPQTAMLSGTGTAPLIPQAVLSPAALSFPATTLNSTSASMSATLSNPGNAVLNIASVALGGANAADFAIVNGCGPTLAAGANCKISATFTPLSAAGFTATITVTDNAAGSPQTAMLSGTGTAPLIPQAVLSPAALSFPATTLNSTSASMSATLSNPGNAVLNIASVALGGANAADFAIVNGCGPTLAAGANCKISATFTPLSAAGFTATITVSDNAADSPQAVTLSGTGTPAPAPIASLSPAAITFPNTTVGTTATAIPVTLSNTGNAALAITGVTIGGTNASAFADTSACGTSLAAGSSCVVSVTFTAAAASTDTATLSVADNAAGSPQTATLTGTGISTGPSTPGFIVAAPNPTQTVAPGGVAQFLLNVTAISGDINAPVVLSVSGLPAGATASFNPATVTPGATGASSTLSVQTPLNAALAVPARPFSPDGHSLWLAALLLVPFLRIRRLAAKLRSLPRIARVLLLGALALGSIGSLTGCGGGYFGPGAKTVTLTITGTSGAMQNSTTVNLTIQ